MADEKTLDLPPEIDFELLKTKIDEKYAQVFTDPEVFKEYFNNTPDTSNEDLLIRAGVFLKRLQDEPNERFRFMKTSSASNRKGLSIHALKTDYSWIKLNGWVEDRIEELEKEQPDDTEKAIRELLQSVAMAAGNSQLAGILGSGNLADGNQVNSYSKPNLDSKLFIELLKMTFDGAEISSSGELRQLRQLRQFRFSVQTDSFEVRITLNKNAIYGDSIRVLFDDDDIPIDAGIEEEYKKYFQQVIIPTQLMNALTRLDPEGILNDIHVKKGHFEIVESVYWEANKSLKRNVFIPRDTNIYAPGYYLDLKAKYALKLGFIDRDHENDENVMALGKIRSVEELWHLLFNKEYPGVLEIKPIDTKSMSIVAQDEDANLTPTYEKIVSRYRNSRDLNGEIEKILGKYRLFTTEDFAEFVIPEGFTPIAVPANEEFNKFVMCIREGVDGLDFCFQLNNAAIVEQTAEIIRSNEAEIERLRALNQSVEARTKKYRSEG